MTGRDGSAEERPAGGTADRLAEPFQVDLDVAEHARVGDALAAGDANFAVDREAVDNLTSALPGGSDTGRRIMEAGAAFRRRALRYVVAEGVRQFLSLGTGITGHDRDHHIVQELAPESRVVYQTADPIVMAHAHQLKGTPEGVVACIHGSLRDPEGIWRQAMQTLDAAQPVAILVRVLAAMSDDEARRLIGQFVAEMAPGSHLVVLHLARDVSVTELSGASERLGKMVREERLRPLRGRTHAEVSSLFDGLDLVPPGVVTVDRWRTQDDDGEAEPLPGNMVPPLYGGVGRKRSA